MFIISYDLKSPQADYEAMFSAIQRSGDALRILESTWILDTTRNEDEISEILHAVIHEGDRFIVAEMRDGHRQGWLARSMWTWMHERDIRHRGEEGADHNSVQNVT